MHDPGGIPELTQAENAARLAALTGGAGGGGMGLAVLAILCTQACPVVTEALLGEGARSWAREVSDMGAPPVGGDPWQDVQALVRTSATSQGRSPETPESGVPASTPASTPPS